MSEIETLSKMFDMHIKECEQREERHAATFKEIKDMFKGIWDAHDDMREVVTKLQIRAALAVGGIIVLAKVADFAIAMVK